LQSEEPASDLAARAKATWARLIPKVYEADPLECHKCNGRMRVIALIEDPGIIRRILDHLGLWAPITTERSQPLGPANWPRYADLPLTRNVAACCGASSSLGTSGRLWAS
jgi:hypothetical protein